MNKKIPKGKLFIIGGAEDMGENDSSIMRRNKDSKGLEILMELVPKKKISGKTYIEIITSASLVPDEVNKSYTRAFKKAGFDKAGFMYVGNNLQAHNPKFIKRINKAHVVFFSGGNQFRLATILGGTDILDAIKQRYLEDKNFIVAGTSAGAMALSEIMILEGENNEAVLNKTLRMSSGLGFIDRCIIDTHFTKRGRFGRLTQTVLMNPTCIGIGVGEDTSLLIKEGRNAECIGSGMVIIIDGYDIGHSNITFAEKDEALSVENLRVHILSSGNGFNLEDRIFIPSQKYLRRERAIERKAKNKNLSHRNNNKTKQKVNNKKSPVLKRRMGSNK